MMTPVMLALNTALHGDLVAARQLFDAVESDAGDDPYAISIWGSFAVTAAAAAGDFAWALRAAETAINADPDFSFTFSGSYPRLARHWAKAMSGGDPVAAATGGGAHHRDHSARPASIEPGHLVRASRPRSSFRARDPSAAMTALDKAEAFIDTYGERYAEGLVLLIRAKRFGPAATSVHRAQGDSPGAQSFARARGPSLCAARETATRLGPQRHGDQSPPLVPRPGRD